MRVGRRPGRAQRGGRPRGALIALGTKRVRTRRAERRVVTRVTRLPVYLPALVVRRPQSQGKKAHRYAARELLVALRVGRPCDGRCPRSSSLKDRRGERVAIRR